LIFAILAQHKDAFLLPERKEPLEIVKLQEARVAVEPAEYKETRVYFENIPFFDRPIDLMLFDATVRGSTEKVHELLPRDAKEEQVIKVMKIYEYMTTIKPERGKDTLLELAAAAVKYAEKYSAPLGLVVGVMQTESMFNPNAESSAKAAGPMQVMWNIHSGLLQANGITSRDQLFTTDLGVAAGCLILSRYLRDEKSVAGGLKRYYGALSGNYISTTYSNWHTYELYASGILETESRTAQAKDRKYLSSLMSGSAKSSAGSKSSTKDTEGTIKIKKTDGSTIVWKAK
jgi:hypothetical protein